MSNSKNKFILKLRKYIDVLPKQTIKTLRGQAIAGDVEGARKGLEKVLARMNEDKTRG